MKPVPIRRKGCKNVGWVWDDKHLNKLVVPLHPGKQFTYTSDKFEYKWITRRGIMSLGHEPCYNGLLKTTKPLKIAPFLKGINTPKTKK